MKRFEFRLARLERLRTLERNAARAALTRALGEVEERRRERDRERRELAEALHTELPEELAADPRAWQQLAEWRQRHRLALIAATERESQASEAVRRAEQAHTEAARAHRVLERLRERKYRRWRQEADAEEQKFLDETHLLRVGRKRVSDDERSDS